MNRRDFLSKSTMAGMSIPFAHLLKSDEAYGKEIASLEKERFSKGLELVENVDYWNRVRELYNPDSSFINLENGYFSPMSLPVYNREINNLKLINSRTSRYMREDQEADVQLAHNLLKRFLGITKGEIAICRNTTEALDTVIHGINWKSGDEIIVSDQDYFSMLEAIDQEVARNGIKKVEIEVPLNPNSDEEIIAAYKSAITSKTRFILITHLINTTGQILPAKKLVEMAHAKGIQVIMDSAHAIAHIDFSIDEIDPDYLGSSLHKWLGCPMGTGLLYIKKKRISEIWPLFGDVGHDKSNIKRFWHWGTRPVSSFKTIERAIEFHNSIGTELKQARLKCLQNSWVEQVRGLKGVILNTPVEKNRSCAIANFGIEGMSPQEIQKQLIDKHNIYSVAINETQFQGVRITPHIYNTIDEIDKLVIAIKTIADE